MIKNIIIVGAGRMGNAIAIAFAYAGIEIALVDVKDRNPAEKNEFLQKWNDSLDQELHLLEHIGMLVNDQCKILKERIHFYFKDNQTIDWKNCELIIEGVPEIMTHKQHCFRWLEPLISKNCIVASTTSTFLVTDIAKLISHPERIVNAHWLNPGYLMPLVELSRSEHTADIAVEKLKTLLEEIGKVPVICNAVAGYIVPRIQALAMNEAARMVEENVASAEDIDKAIRTGFGLRFSVLGMLEFIDWGGGDILYHASEYLREELGERYKAPDIIKKNMRENRNGIRELSGFYKYESMDIYQYKLNVISKFAENLRFNQLIPQYEIMK